MEKSMAQKNERVSNQQIPSDLVFSILSKLPLKSLKRFGCVHKSWAHLFENPHFMSLYHNNFLSNNHSYYADTSLLLQQTPQSYGYNFVLYLFSGERFENRVKLDYPPPFQVDEKYIFILGSVVNGTFCLYQGYERIVLWNPATEEFNIIPHSPLESPPPYEINQLQLHGFGYGHVRDDYKVIRYIHYREDLTDFEGDMEDVPQDLPHDPVWEIYSLRSNSWRKLDIDMPDGFMGPIGVHVYLNGVCHWWGASTPHYDEAYLVSFDLSNETFLTTPIPSGMDDDLTFDLLDVNLVVLNGSISLILKNPKTTSFHISILGELGVKKSWIKLFIIGPLPFIVHPFGVEMNSIFLSKNDDKLA